MRQYRLSVLFLGVAALGSAGWSSEIGSASKVRSAWDVHETISLLAARCANSVTKPESCGVHARSILDLVEQTTAKSDPPGAGADESYFPRAARWSDDPMRMLHGGLSTALFGITLFNECKGALAKGEGIDQRGMLCASHFGPMQFAHAQDSIPANSYPQSAQALVQSRTKMVQWARFAFRAAVDPAFASSGLCSAIAQADFAAIQSSLARPSVCDDRRPFTVASFFSGHCRSLSFDNCVDLSRQYGDRYVRHAGPGAILHLIQDSYSQSHAARLPANMNPVGPAEVFPSLSACRRIATFYDYNAQKDAKSETHNNADKPPLIDTSCVDGTREADDVITASARAIWLVQQAWARPDQARALEDELARDLESRVLTLRGVP